MHSHFKTICVPEGVILWEKPKKYVDLLTENYGFIIQKSIEIPKYELVYMSKSVGLSAIKLDFINCKVFGIYPGTKVETIGEGRNQHDNAI